MRTQLHTPEGREAAVTMRLAGPADDNAMRHLAALDSKPVPAGDVVVAEVGGRLRAAVPVAGGDAIADPFERTAHLVALLRERASQLATPLGVTPRRRHGLATRLHAA